LIVTKSCKATALIAKIGLNRSRLTLRTCAIDQCAGQSHGNAAFLLRTQISKTYANASIPDEVGLFRAKERGSRLNGGQAAAETSPDGHFP
jgi:hypothetical protein